MNFKFSHVALAFVAAASFCAAAETIVPGSKSVVDADIVVRPHSKLLFGVIPMAYLSLDDVKKGKATTVAKFKIVGSVGNDAAVRLRASEAHDPMCADLVGASNNNNKMQVCLDSPAGNFVEDGVTYYKYPDGEFPLVSGMKNTVPGAPVAADSYKMAIEAVRFTM